MKTTFLTAMGILGLLLTSTTSFGFSPNKNLVGIKVPPVSSPDIRELLESVSGGFIVKKSDDKSCVVKELGTDKQIQTFFAPDAKDQSINRCVFDPSGKTIVVSSDLDELDGSKQKSFVHVFSFDPSQIASNREPVAFKVTFTIEEPGVRGFALTRPSSMISADGNLLAVAGDKKVCLYTIVHSRSLGNKICYEEIFGKKMQSRAINFSHNGKWIVVGKPKGSFQIFKITPSTLEWLETVETPYPNDFPVCSLQFSPDDLTISTKVYPTTGEATKGWEIGTIFRWDVSNLRTR